MGMRTESKTIGGLEVTTTQLSAMRSMKLMAKLGKLAAPVLSALQTSTGEIDLNSLGPAIGTALASLDNQKTEELILGILASTVVVAPNAEGTMRRYDLNTASSFDAVFNGNPSAVIATLVFVLGVNYSSFFEGGASPALPAVKV